MKRIKLDFSRQTFYQMSILTVLLIMGLSFQNCGGFQSASSGSGSNTSSNISPLGGGAPPSLITGTSKEIMGLKECIPSGVGNDYTVGPGQTFAEIADVPWENIGPGDTVRIFYRETPYKGKFLLFGKGTAQKPIRVCGVRSPEGYRPSIEGADAVVRQAIPYKRGDGIYLTYREQWGVILIDSFAGADYQYFPEYIQVDGLKISKAHPKYNFISGAPGVGSLPFHEFGGCIWVERGHHITLADNEITDCSQAIDARSTDEGAFAQVTDLKVVGNYMWNNGVSGTDRIHTTYIEANRVTYEFNYYGPLREGGGGNSLKDRSIGTVIRYNRFEAGAHSIDLVDAEDFPNTALADPLYRVTYVYGNQIRKDGCTGTTIHYGGDHMGSEYNNRKGTLYFYHNSLNLENCNIAVIFQITTTDEKVEAWNNVFAFSDNVQYPSMRANQEVDTGTTGGIVNLYKNWIVDTWADSDPYHPVSGQLNGIAQLVLGKGLPFDLTTFQPTKEEIVDSAIETPSTLANMVSAYPVQYQLNESFIPVVREMTGAKWDLGAVEKK